MSPKPDSALLIIGHGSTVNPDSSAPTFAHAAEIRNQGLFGEVACAFWMEEPSMRHALKTIKSNDVYVVPNFISEGYFTQKVIPRELEIHGAVTVRGERTIKYCEPVGNHPRMTDLLVRRAREAAPGVPPGETSLLIIGHGTSLNENSGTAVKEQARRIAERGEFAEVFGVFMEEEPFVASWPELIRKRNVVAVPFFVSDGLHSYQQIPLLLGIATEETPAGGGTELLRRNPTNVKGRAVYYSSALGTAPGFAGIILDQVEAFDMAHTKVTHE